MSKTFKKVLDHGHVRLVSYMQPVPMTEEEQLLDQGYLTKGQWTGDLEVVRNARVSYNAEWRAGEDKGKDAGLINYLYTNRHTSPFEAMVFTFDIKCPMFVARQWHRHRTWSFNEVSARYTELPEEFYIPEENQITTQSKSNKQMRTDEVNEHAPWFMDHSREHCEAAFDLYKQALAKGIPRELARGILPVDTYTHYFGTVDLHNLFHFLRLRLHEHSQYEIRVYAKAMLELIEPVVPQCVAAFRKTL